MQVGIDFRPSNDASPQTLHPAPAAKRAEELELDSMWVADNLVREDKDILECLMLLATAGAVTTRLKLGVGVLQICLRGTAWTAKQVATLQWLTGDRLIFGVGAGGTFPSEWAAAGKSTSTRGRMTNAMLEVLPALLAGQSVDLPDSLTNPVVLKPAVTVPPIWIGGHSPGAMERTARYADGWLPALQTPSRLRAHTDEIAEMAASFGRPAPKAGVQLHADLTAKRGDERHNKLSSWMQTRFKLSEDEADEIALTGSPEQIAERLRGFRDVGCELVVVSPLGEDWGRQAEILAEARQLALA